MILYTLVRSMRKTIAIHINRDAAIEVRAPLKLSKAEIDKFVFDKQDWIEKTLRKAIEREEKALLISKCQEFELKIKAEKIIPERVAFYANIMDVNPASVKIGGAKKLWGSCSNKHDLNFSWYLMLTDINVVDYVVVHELAHIKEYNHSENFWLLVKNVLPDYKERQKRLREMPVML